MLLLPALPYGTETNQMKFPLAMNLNPTTLARVITDLVDSLAAHGILRCVLLNGHGGNDLKWVLRELHLCNDGASLSLQLVQGMHPTSMRRSSRRRTTMPARWRRAWGWLISRDLVALEQADAGAVRPSRFEAVNRGWVEITRPWHLLTTNSGAGDPRAATAAKGEALTALVVERIGRFLVRAGREPARRDISLSESLAVCGWHVEDSTVM